jgi:hypothetical protein
MIAGQGRRIDVAATRFRYVVVFLRFAIAVVNYIDRAAIWFSIPLMEHSLGPSKADGGRSLAPLASAMRSPRC